MDRKKFLDKFAIYFDAIESLFIVSLSISLFLMYKEVAQAIYGVFASLGLLALLYLLMSMRPFEGKVAGIRIVIRRVVYVSYVLSSLSIMSSLTFDEEVDTKSLLCASLVFLFVSLILMILKRVKMKEPEKFLSHVIRISIFGLILGWLYSMY